MVLDWLDDFLALASAQSFSRAASERNVTQPAFSRRIQMLEKWVGADLFQRLPRRTILTPAGEHFHAAIESIPRSLRSARMEALDAAGKVTRTLSIAATHALSFTFFPEWARKNVDTASFGTLNLLSDSMSACEDLLLRGDASFLLCHRHSEDTTRLSTRQFNFKKVGHDRLIPLVAPNAKGKPLWTVTMEAAKATPFLAYAPQSGMSRILDARWRAQGAAPNLQQVMTARLSAALLSLAEEGRGVAWLPSSLATESIKKGRLIEASREASFSIPIDIVLYRPLARLSATAERFWATVSGLDVKSLPTK
jgi:DNA-binding transcriptional LysR family regulator